MESNGKIETLMSRMGRPYLGIHIDRDLSLTLVKMLSDILSPSYFEDVTRNQQRRDSGRHHITVVRPKEFEVLNQTVIESILGQEVEFSILGIGEACREDKKTFYGIVESKDIQLLRERLGFDISDLHITLGFYIDDVHTVRKDRSTLIQHNY
ncbi:MAG: hypothetical protein HQ501_04875 [Rhodospirillales bacterium]|nr:hypothetical protein [Rhodospirillales bacterium]